MSNVIKLYLEKVQIYMYHTSLTCFFYSFPSRLLIRYITVVRSILYSDHSCKRRSDVSNLDFSPDDLCFLGVFFCEILVKTLVYLFKNAFFIMQSTTMILHISSEMFFIIEIQHVMNIS